MSRVPFAPLVLVAALLSAGACNDRVSAEPDPIPAQVRDYAAARCQQLAKCDCANATFPDADACEDEIIARYRDFLLDRDNDLECFSRAAGIWRRGTCDEPVEDGLCQATARTDEFGAACQPDLFDDFYIRTSTCGEGLTCAQDQCVSAVDDAAQGSPCAPGGLCGNELTCMAETCQRPRSLGETCEHSSNCEPATELQCEQGVCAPRKPAGQSCLDDRECLLTNICMGGRCSEIDPYICVLADF